MASTGTDGTCQVENSLSCGVCFEQYDDSTHLPQILPCQHTFCNQCIDSMLSETKHKFVCPVCRNKVASATHIRTNLAVRDIVDALARKKTSKLVCPEHPSKECILICLDCCHPMCTLCVKGLTKSVHKEHSIDDVDDALSTMKKRLASVLEKKITGVEKASSEEIGRLMEEAHHHIEEVNTVTSMVTSAIVAWNDEHLRDLQRRTQHAISKETEARTSLIASWEDRLKVSECSEVLNAYSEVENNSNANTAGVKNTVSLQQDDVDRLQNMICWLCEAIKDLMADDALPRSSQVAGAPPYQECPNDKRHVQLDSGEQSDCKGSSSAYCVQDVRHGAATRNVVQEQAVVHPTRIVHPHSNAADPLQSVATRATGAFDSKRNNTFLRVVHDYRRGNDKLLCETDDFVYTFYCRHEEKHVIRQRWEAEEEALLLEWWTDVSHKPKYADKLRMAIAYWMQALVDMRCGDIRFKEM